MIEQENNWLEEVSRDLKNSVRGINDETLSKLMRIRNQALDRTALKKRHLYRLPAAALIAACLVLAVVFNLPEQQAEQQEMINDLDLITTSESLELLEDLEFYEWLDVYDLPT